MATIYHREIVLPELSGQCRVEANSVSVARLKVKEMCMLLFVGLHCISPKNILIP